MRRISKWFFILATCTFLSSLATADVTLKFDDLAAPTKSWARVSGCWDNMPSSYGGLTWSSTVPNDLEYISDSCYNKVYQNSLAFPSSPYAVYNDEPDVLGSRSTINSVEISGTRFTFASASFATFLDKLWNSCQYCATSVTVVGTLHGAPVGTETVDLNTDGSFATVSFGWTVDDLKFTPTGAKPTSATFLMDNLTLATPEAGFMPSFLLMAGVLLASLLVVRVARGRP